MLCMCECLCVCVRVCVSPHHHHICMLAYNAWLRIKMLKQRAHKIRRGIKRLYSFRVDMFLALNFKQIAKAGGN